MEIIDPPFDFRGLQLVSCLQEAASKVQAPSIPDVKQAVPDIKQAVPKVKLN